MSSSRDKCLELLLTLRTRDSLTGVQKDQDPALISRFAAQLHEHGDLEPWIRDLNSALCLSYFIRFDLCYADTMLLEVRRPHLHLQGGFPATHCPLGSPFLHQLSTASYKSTVQPGVLDHHLRKSHLSHVLSRHAGAFAQRTKVQNGVELDGVAPSTYKYTREEGGGHPGKQNQLS